MVVHSDDKVVQSSGETFSRVTDRAWRGGTMLVHSDADGRPSTALYLADKSEELLALAKDTQ